MSVSMYQISVPPLLRGLGVLSALLRKGEAHADATSMLEARLAPDMMTLVGQVQRASDTAKGCAARLAGLDAPAMPDTEASFADLQSRISRTVDFLQSIKREQIDGSEAKPISFKAGQSMLNFTGESYVLTFVLPNFYFHVTAAYAILRHKGVPLSKLDYLGPR
ncbi:MAG: DUF1993 domain-containing protein [Pseudolabrys sp.]|nr:DUF1993 domain-containing protein [Pseudolabrys sp.]